MIDMLKDFNITTEVTKMEEMYKLFNTPFEGVRSEVYIEGINELNILPTQKHYESRTSMNVNNVLILYSNIHANVTDSKSLNKIIHQQIPLKIKKDTRILGTTFNLSTNDRRNNFDIYTFFDEKAHIGHVVVINHERNDYLYGRYDVENFEKVLRNLLRNQLDARLDASKLSDELRKLWLHQIQTDLKQTNHTAKTSNELLNNVIDVLTSDMTDVKQAQMNNVTYRQLFEFFDEVKNEQITEKTKEVQDWISYGETSNIYQSFLMHDNHQKLEDTFELADFKNVNYIKQALLSDKHFNSKWQVGNVYKVNDKKRKNQKYPQRFTGIHGTPNRTVMSIMLNGLKTNHSLEKENIDHNYTASGLGVGVYFARLDQASKSANYAKSSHASKRFLIVADVDYDEQNMLKTRQYDSSIDSSKYTLIHGQKVGSHNIDEIVAPDDRNINIRFIVEIHYKSKR